jgi:lipopolysaccharide export system protein LptA
MRWQKAARLVIAVFIIAFAGFVFHALRRSGSVPAKPETLTIDDKPVIQSIGGTSWKRYDKSGKVVFSINCEGQKTYDDGRNVCQRATITLPDRNGRTITINSDEAEAVNPGDATGSFSTALVRGHVKLQTSDDLLVTCNEGTYNEKDGILQVPGPVTFTRGRMNGKGTGATYDRGRDVLWILADAQVAVTPDATGGGALQATSGMAGLARADHYIRLSKAAHVVADNRTIDSDELMAALTEDDSKVQRMELRGNSRIVGTGPGAQSMSAKDIDLTYAPDGRTLQTSKLMEQSVVQLASDGGPRRITARMIDMTMSADGSAVTSLNATENVLLELAGQGTAPAKTIRASTLVGAGSNGAGIDTATFEGPIDYRESRAARGTVTAIDRQATARRLIVHTKPGLGDLQQAEFRGNVKFVNGTDTTGEAQVGVYQVEQDRLDLGPSPTDPGPPPTVTNDEMTVHARTISMTMGSEHLSAETDVRSIMERKPAPAGRGRGRGANGRSQEATKVPSLLNQDQPVTIRSNRLEYDGSASHAVYTGAVRLTQPGGTELQAESIELDDKSGNLTADTKVRTKMMLDDVDPKTKQRTSTETTGTADHFVYEDAKRLATYTSAGTVLAHLVGAIGDLTAKRLDLFLKPEENELERLEADGTVTTIENNRTAHGRHLTYTASDETYVMVGSPVEMVAKETTSCKQTLAGSLRFQRAVDNITTEGSPVRATNIPCPGTRD